MTASTPPASTARPVSLAQSLELGRRIGLVDTLQLLGRRT